MTENQTTRESMGQADALCQPRRVDVQMDEIRNAANLADRKRLGVKKIEPKKFTYGDAQDMAETALPFALFIRSMFNGDITREQLLASYALGLSGEAVEVSRADATESRDEWLAECGDFAHYAVGLIDLLGLGGNEIFAAAVLWANDADVCRRPQDEMMANAALLGDQIKKLLFHGKPREVVEPLIKARLSESLGAFLRHISNRGVTLGECMDNNVAKLRARHGGKFQAG